MEENTELEPLAPLELPSPVPAPPAPTVTEYPVAATAKSAAVLYPPAPPPPPLPNMDAALGWGGERFYIQILGVDDVEHDLMEV